MVTQKFTIPSQIHRFTFSAGSNSFVKLTKLPSARFSWICFFHKTESTLDFSRSLWPKRRHLRQMQCPHIIVWFPKGVPTKRQCRLRLFHRHLKRPSCIRQDLDSLLPFYWTEEIIISFTHILSRPSHLNIHLKSKQNKSREFPNLCRSAGFLDGTSAGTMFIQLSNKILLTTHFV